MATPQHKNPCSGGHEIYKFGRPFLGHHYYTLSLFDLCLDVEKKIFKEIMQFHYMTYMATPVHKNPCPRGHEIYNFGRPFLGHHYYILGLSDLCLGIEKNIFKEIMQFHYMTYMATYRRRFFNFVNSFSLFLNYLPLEKGGALHLNKLESPSPKDALCQVRLKLAQGLWRRIPK